MSTCIQMQCYRSLQQHCVNPPCLSVLPGDPVLLLLTCFCFFFFDTSDEYAGRELVGGGGEKPVIISGVVFFTRLTPHWRNRMPGLDSTIILSSLPAHSNFYRTTLYPSDESPSVGSDCGLAEEKWPNISDQIPCLEMSPVWFVTALHL